MHSRPYFVDWELVHLLYCIVLQEKNPVKHSENVKTKHFSGFCNSRVAVNSRKLETETDGLIGQRLLVIGCPLPKCDPVYDHSPTACRRHQLDTGGPCTLQGVDWPVRWERGRSE